MECGSMDRSSTFKEKINFKEKDLKNKENSKKKI